MLLTDDVSDALPFMYTFPVPDIQLPDQFDVSNEAVGAVLSNIILNVVGEATSFCALSFTESSTVT